MAIKLENHIIKGMLRDLAKGRFSPEFVFDALNIRLTAREGNTLLSVTNERGTKECILKDYEDNIVSILGKYIGHCVLNNYLILFTTGELDIIYRLSKEQDYFRVLILFSGNLKFSINYPLETLGIYETELVLKVYWTDNLNPIRYINITKVYESDYNFNLVKELPNEITVSVRRIEGSGSFSSGVILYAVTLYDKFGSETRIAYITDLYYCSPLGRGGSPEETVGCSFYLDISSLKELLDNYEYIRIYSIHRASLDATPSVKLVADISTSSALPYLIEIAGVSPRCYVTYTDRGNVGEQLDPTILLYIGGENLIAKTLVLKDLTLFAGNIKLTTKTISKDIRLKLKNLLVNYSLDSYYTVLADTIDTTYPYNNSLSHGSNDIKGFKSRETYRFGIQVKDKTGVWSEVIFLQDKECNVNPSIYLYENEIRARVPIATITISSEISELLIDNGYTHIRGVCVYPDFNNRSVICLGVLCPTVYNVLDRYTNSPHSQPSWFTRPIPYNEDWINEYLSVTFDSSTPEDPKHSMEEGEILFFNHEDVIRGGKSSITSETLNAKWYNISRAEVLTSDALYLGGTKDVIQLNRGSFGVDCGTVTMYSPDIEFDSSTGYMNDANYKFRIVGAVKMANTLSDVSITTSTSGFFSNDVGFFGNTVKNKSTKQSMNLISGRGIATFPFWSAAPKVKEGPLPDNASMILWAVYPWHRSGSLISSGVPEDGEKRYWELKRKIISLLWFSSHTTYFDDLYTASISPVNTWHSGDSLIKIKVNGDPNRDYYSYYGDIDKVIAYLVSEHKRTGANGESYGYDIYGADSLLNREYIDTNEIANNFNKYVLRIIDLKYLWSSGGEVWWNIKPKDCVGVEPVSMKYKSGPHAVFTFDFIPTQYSDGSIIPVLTILPNNGYNKNDRLDSYSSSLYGDNNVSYKQDTISFSNPTNLAFLWLGELYRESVPNRFGGDTDEDILNNTWQVASKEVVILRGSERTIYYRGDTYLQRYDALRTYEYTSEDTNSIVDILSFICETRVNIDGRYDRNRGNTSNLTATPLNFNLLNQVYSQDDNFFTYHTLDYSRFSNNYFPNTIVWSKEKHNSEEIDSWTNLNMLSSLDLDGNRGEIESLNTFNNEIYCFQKRGLSNILFNSRVQIPSSDSVPIEITNGLKVSGKRYISNTVGCSNKWSIAESPSGLYFIDNETNSIYLFNGLIQSLSDKLGFRLWIGENNSNELWEPVNYNNFRTYYDKNNDDVYFINNKTCLCYSELLNQFTSFMSYEKVPAMFNIGSEFYSFNKNKLWHNFEGDYNMFYGEFKPYNITIVANSDEPYDKIFNTLEFRADSYDNDTLINDKTFDTLEVWNEYLHGSSKLESIKGYPSVLKKKFRIWRANIPRDDKNHRDRIRNTWAYIKLSMNTPNKWKTELHDMNVYYFI